MAHASGGASRHDGSSKVYMMVKNDRKVVKIGETMHDPVDRSQHPDVTDKGIFTVHGYRSAKNGLHAENEAHNAVMSNCGLSRVPDGTKDYFIRTGRWAATRMSPDFLKTIWHQVELAVARSNYAHRN